MSSLRDGSSGSGAAATKRQRVDDPPFHVIMPAPKVYKQPLQSSAYTPAFFDRRVLFEYVNNPTKYPHITFCETDKFIVIYDIFPKARVHLLILTKAAFLDNSSCEKVSDLNSSHLDLLLEMKELSKYLSSHIAVTSQMNRNIVNNNTRESIELPVSSSSSSSGRKKIEIMVGFHIVPSLVPLHLHVISNDFQSDSLKTKVHYNSFSTDFFVPVDTVIRSIKMNPKIVQNLYDKYRNGRNGHADSRKINCFFCGELFKTMPVLKGHIGTCFRDYDSD